MIIVVVVVSCRRYRGIVVAVIVRHGFYSSTIKVPPSLRIVQNTVSWSSLFGVSLFAGGGSDQVWQWFFTPFWCQSEMILYDKAVQNRIWYKGCVTYAWLVWSDPYISRLDVITIHSCVLLFSIWSFRYNIQQTSFIYAIQSLFFNNCYYLAKVGSFYILEFMRPSSADEMGGEERRGGSSGCEGP